MSLEQSKAMSRSDWDADEIDWDAVYVDQLPRVYNYLRFRLGVEAEAEDLTARAFEKAWRARHRYRSDLAGFSTWLFRIAHNVGVDWLRARREVVSIDDTPEPADATTPEHEAERDSDLARLAELCRGLSERDQELIALKYGAELDNRAIARLTGLSETNVGTILYRAVATLRKRW